ncbi:A-kinase anchor protein 12 isoform X2 [Sander lucioperca]|uniref:A-kinase anchor protein 12 isoform X2 n=1 Tax=Sander lucioperca TaxID=283035 RepID=UPI001653CDBF|nr:A-kinase anchor protein 12 isoform X2 [Sander lucioperca]
MGDAQSAHREGKEDAAAEGDSGKVDDAQTEQNIEDEPLKNNGQISEINGKADGSIAEVGHCEDEIDAEAILSSDEDVSETEKPLKEEETPLNVEINEKESPNEADANEDVPLEITEMDAKQNDINESFRKFFRNIGLNLTVKRGSGEIATDVPDETNKVEPNRAEDVEDTTKETTSENAEQNADVNITQETYDNDSTTCPTLTDVTSDILENAEEKTEETKEEVESDNVDAAMTSPVGEHAQQDATPEEESHSTSPCSPEEEVVVSPIKRFFTTGIFSGLRKKKKPAEDETTDKEPEDKGGKEVEETREQTVQDKQQDIEEISLGVDAAAIETEHKENILKGEILSAVSAQVMDASAIDPSTIIVTEPDILNSQEKDKVQASPLKRLLSGSSLKKLSKKQRGRKSSDAKLSDSGEHVSDQLLSSTGSAENQKEEGCAQHSAEAVGEEDGAWASFKKLVTPKKRIKRSSLSNEETQIPGSVEEPKPSEGGQISDLSTEEGKKRKDSSVSWESVLCGSGRRRSRKTSDSEDEILQIDKQDDGSKHGTELALESSNEVDEMLAYSPKEAGSSSEGDGGSTWKSLKRLVTPKKKAKDEDESKDHVQSDSEVTQDESSFSIKKLLPGRKKRKSAERQDQVSSDEADKDVASGDEDSETPAVVPLSEFDTVETEVHIQTQADVESHIPKEGDHELQQDLLDQMVEPVIPCDNLQTEVKEVQDNVVALENQASKPPATNEEPGDFTESISKQQLSDIPEEATPASATEEAARDDTIAEDLIEITSEAITAPEPLDITLADETEMISAVSQLSSESSKTSGNTTPVPAEYDFMETDVLLHQVVETISISPNTVPVCSNELRSERMVSVSHQILETFVKEEPTILEIHRRLDATAINTGLNVEELDTINELAATTETESIFEVNDSYSTEFVSEVPTEEFHTAEIAVDEVHEVNITHQEDSLKELESIDESHHLVECPSEINAAVSKDILPEGDKIVPDEGSLVKAHQAKTEPPKIDAQEADSAAIVADETKDGAMEQEVQTVTEKEDQITHNITDQIQVKDKDQEIILEDITAAKTVTYELKEETVPLTEVNMEPEKEDEIVTDAKTGNGKVPEAFDTVQASTLDLGEGSVQSQEEEVKSEDIPTIETVTEKPKQTEEHLTQVNVEPENKELKANAVKSEHIQESEAVQVHTLASEESSVQSLEKELISEDVPEAAKVTGEPKEEKEMRAEPEEKLPMEATKTEHVQELEGVSGQSLEEEVISKDVPEAATITDEPIEEIILLTEVKFEPVEASQTEHVQEPGEVLEAVQAPTLDSEESSVQSLEKVLISEDVPDATVTGELKGETIPLTEENLEPVDVSKAEHVQEPEVIQAIQTVTCASGVDSLLLLKKEVISEDIPAVETVTNEPKQETDVRAEPKEKLPMEAAKTEHVKEPNVLLSNVKEIVTESKTEEGTSVYVDVVTECIERDSAKELEKQILVKDDPKPDNVNVSIDEIESEVVAQLDHSLEITEDQKIVSITQDLGVEQEECIPEDELQTLTAVCVSFVNEEENNVLVLEKTAFTEETPAPCVDNAAVTNKLKHEVHISTVQVSVEVEKEREIKTAEVEHAVVAQVVTCNLKEEVETATPLVKDDVVETAEEGSMVVMMHVPSVEFEDKHRVQVQVVDVNIKSAETIVDTVQEVGVTEAKEVPESVVDNLEQEVIKQPDAVTEVSEMVESDTNEVEDQKVMEDNIATIRERQDEAPAVISDVSATEQQVSKDLMQTPDIPGSLDVSIHDHKEDLEETKAKQEKSEAGVTAKEVKSSSEELDVKTINEEAQITHIAQSPIVTLSNTNLVAPQNTGIISSIANVESPSSLSFEFKLNIQFGQAKAASLSSTTERNEPVKKTEVSEVRVQAVEVVEPVKPINPTQRAESQKQTELKEVAVQATEPVANLDSTERAVITTQPVLLDIGIQAMKTVEPVEQIESTERVTSSVQATETIKPVIQVEKGDVFLSQPVLSEACEQETKAETPVQQKEEENDQDVWMDAEEDISTQEKTEVSLHEVEESVELPTESEQVEKAGLEDEVEMVPNSKTEEEESQQEMHKADGKCEIESDDEDFAVALEHSETQTASITTMERN